MDGEQILAGLAAVWPHLLAAAGLAIDLWASGHVVLYKRDSRAAVSWIGIVWLVPFVGALLYLMLGINRLQRRAVRFRRPSRPLELTASGSWPVSDASTYRFAAEAAHLSSLAELVERVTCRPLTVGNQVTPLPLGDTAYPAMLQAIDEARHTVALSSYIFDNDPVGRIFVDALGRAVARGVQVRVLIDDIGARYSWPSIEGRLRAARVPTSRFMRTLFRLRLAYANLRSHRKLLIVDGRLGFTGGLNIREGHWLSRQPSHPVRDLHFRLAGPVVGHLQEVFANDWQFASGETLPADVWFPPLQEQGSVLARGISTGPDSDHGKSRLTLLGALASARRHISIITPYFLPDVSLVTALNVAALRGVSVDILLPGENNLSLVKWASTAQLWQVLERGCRVWLSPPPFDHTKLTVVDRAWVLFGSSNWDPRSMRLNFEFDVECYDLELAAALHDDFTARRRQAREVTLQEVDGRSFPARLRDGLARLLAPYL
jgi:cardiolipin synthase